MYKYCKIKYRRTESHLVRAGDSVRHPWPPGENARASRVRPLGEGTPGLADGILLSADAPQDRLVDERRPAGRRGWNYDAENRKALPPHLALPPRRRFVPDTTARDVMVLVEPRCGDHFGDLDAFGWAVTREDALAALRYFLTNGPAQFWVAKAYARWHPFP